MIEMTRDCLRNLVEVEISASSLLSFKYYGPQIKFCVEHVPQLVDLSIGDFNRAQATRDIGPFISCFPRLKNLDLQYYFDEVYMQFPQCELPKLRHLTLFSPCCRESLLYLIYIMKACTFLQKLTLKFFNTFHGGGREIHQIPKYTFQHLKVVELCGLHGNASDLELASYLLESTTMLEKVIVKFSLSLSNRECLEMLEPMLPQGVQLLVINL